MHHGQRPDDPIEVSDVDGLWRERDRLSRYLGPGDEERFLRTLEIYFRFCRMPAEVFDNSRLLAEGIPPPPPFTSYLGGCVESSLYDLVADPLETTNLYENPQYAAARASLQAQIAVLKADARPGYFQ